MFSRQSTLQFRKLLEGALGAKTSACMTAGIAHSHKCLLPAHSYSSSLKAIAHLREARIAMHVTKLATAAAPMARVHGLTASTSDCFFFFEAC